MWNLNNSGYMSLGIRGYVCQDHKCHSGSTTSAGDIQFLFGSIISSLHYLSILLYPMHKLPNKLRPIVVIDGTNMETEFQTQKVFYSVFALLIDQMLIIKGNVDRVP